MAGQLLGTIPTTSRTWNPPRTPPVNCWPRRRGMVLAEATDGSIEIRGSEQVLQGATTVPEAALKALVAQLPEDGYVSVQAY